MEVPEKPQLKETSDVVAIGKDRSHYWFRFSHQRVRNGSKYREESGTNSDDLRAHLLKVQVQAETWFVMQWTPTTTVTGYRLYLNGAQQATTTQPAYNYSYLQCGTTYTVGVAGYTKSATLSHLDSEGDHERWIRPST